MKASKPGNIFSSLTASPHCRATTGLTGKPSRAWRSASTNRSSNGSAPKRSDSAAQPDTWPGTVTVSQPRAGMSAMPLKRSGCQPAGERPDAFRPCSRLPSHTSANASPPMPFITGSTTVRVMAAASAASMALPPRAKAAAPACAARGCDVAMTLRASTGCRPEGWGRFEFMVVPGWRVKASVLRHTGLPLWHGDEIDTGHAQRRRKPISMKVTGYSPKRHASSRRLTGRTNDFSDTGSLPHRACRARRSARLAGRCTVRREHSTGAALRQGTGRVHHRRPAVCGCGGRGRVVPSTGGAGGAPPAQRFPALAQHGVVRGRAGAGGVGLGAAAHQRQQRIAHADAGSPVHCRAGPLALSGDDGPPGVDRHVAVAGRWGGAGARPGFQWRYAVGGPAGRACRNGGLGCRQHPLTRAGRARSGAGGAGQGRAGRDRDDRAGGGGWRAAANGRCCGGTAAGRRNRLRAEPAFLSAGPTCVRCSSHGLGIRLRAVHRRGRGLWPG